MKPQRFTGETARAALSRVRAALGADAVILSNRRVGDLTEILAISPQAIDAITAATVADAPPRTEPPQATPLRELIARAAPAPRDAAGAPVKPAPGDAADKILLQELRSMKGLLAEQLSSITLSDNLRRSPLRSTMMRTLLGAGFSAALARGIISRLPDDFNGNAAGRWLHDVVTRNIPPPPAAELTDAGGVFALVGPTGVGKTTTIAKLAARCVMKHGAAGLGLIAADDYRVGAQDQLRVYARLLGVPVYAAQTAEDLRQGLAEMAGKRLVLIDTTGMSQRDPRIVAQHDQLHSAGVQRLLVINATAQAETLDEVARAYAGQRGRGVPLAGAIITKLDEAARIGCALDVVIRRRLALHYTCAGQRVPEDIAPTDTAALARSVIADGAKGGASRVFALGEDESSLVLAGGGGVRA